MRVIDELKQKRHWHVTQARKIKDAVDKENREFTAEEKSHFESHMSEFDSIADKIKAEERMASAESVVTEIVERDAKPVDSRDKVIESLRSYLRTGMMDAEQRALQADVNTAGGYAVPSEFSTDLIKALDNMVFVRPISSVVSIPKAESLGIPTIANRMGDATWTKELLIGSEDSTLDFGKRELFPHPLARYILVSNTLLRKSPLPIEQIVRDELAYNFSIVEENAFMNGSGANQPLGVFVASDNGISTSRDVSTGNTSANIKADNLKACKYTLPAAYRNGCVWVFHRDAISQLASLKDGNGRYLWQDSIAAAEPDRLLGFPAYESEYAPNTFTTGLYVGILGNFRYYRIADALSMSIQRLNELGAATDQTYFIGRKETDGMPVLENAFVRVTLG